jgi:hypothetical protein
MFIPWKVFVPFGAGSLVGIARSGVQCQRRLRGKSFRMAFWNHGGDLASP